MFKTISPCTTIVWLLALHHKEWCWKNTPNNMGEQAMSKVAFWIANFRFNVHLTSQFSLCLLKAFSDHMLLYGTAEQH